MKNYEELKGPEVDTILERGSIGTGNAATTLFHKLGCEGRIEMPGVCIMGGNETI